MVKYTTEDEYRRHFRQKYCQARIATFDGILVRFSMKDFDHAFYECSTSIWPSKNKFSLPRAERIDWIEAALLDNTAKLKIGWDNKKKKLNKSRRVIVANGNYVVVIQLLKSGNARFITAFLADNYRTLLQILSLPDWTSP
ncbi:MAG: hypothetical protein ACLFVK_06460 [Dehalococcoidia bacterium]